MTRPWWRMVAGCLKGRWKGGGGVAGQMVSPFLVRQIVESGLHFHLRAQFIWLRHHEEVSSSSHGQNRKLCSGSAASSFLLLFFFLRKNPVTPFYFPFFIWFLLAWLYSGPIFGGWALFVVSLPRSVLFFFAFLWKKCDFYCDNLCIRKLWLITVAKCRGQITPTGQNDVLFIFVFGSANVLSAFSLFDPFKHKLCPEFVM